MKVKSFILFFMFLFIIKINAQTTDYELGSAPQSQYRQPGGYFDYSDPRTMNIKVAVWGYVKYPGKYIVPVQTTPSDLLSLAGGPTTDAELEDLRLYRLDSDSLQQMIKFDLNDLLWEKNLKSDHKVVPSLEAGDILLVPGAPRYFFREWLSIGLSIFSALISLAILLTR
ncbi:MAG: SLBB domain-containing protein [bacterium]